MPVANAADHSNTNTTSTQARNLSQLVSVVLLTGSMFASSTQANKAEAAYTSYLRTLLEEAFVRILECFLKKNHAAFKWYL